MMDPRGILVAGALAVVVTGVHAGYRSWPVTHGTEVYVPAALIAQPGSAALVAVRLSFAAIALDVPHTSPPVAEPVEALPRIGAWWVQQASPRANVVKLRGRPLYVQLTADKPLWAGGPVQMRPASVSDAPVDGAMNVAGIATSVRDDGYVALDFSFAPLALPSAAAARARSFIPLGLRQANVGPLPPVADPGVSAVLRVLPSGRAALMGVIVDGTRY